MTRTIFLSGIASRMAAVARIRRVCAVFAGLLFTIISAQSQSYRSLVNEGNELYRQKQYDMAKERYGRAAVLDTGRYESAYNLGNASYRTDAFGDALTAYKKAGEKAHNTSTAASLFYNAGTTFLSAADKGMPVLPDPAAAQGEDTRMKEYRSAIRMFKESLKLDPSSEDARYNLAYAQKKLRELENQKNNQNKNDDKQKQNQKNKNDQNKDQQNKDQQKNDQQNKDQQKNDQQKNDQQKNDQQKNDQQKNDNTKQQQKQKPGDQNQDQKNESQKQQQRPQNQRQMSKQQAEQILRALERDETNLQKRLRAKSSTRVNVDKDW